MLSADNSIRTVLASCCLHAACGKPYATLIGHCRVSYRVQRMNMAANRRSITCGIYIRRRKCYQTAVCVRCKDIQHATPTRYFAALFCCTPAYISKGKPVGQRRWGVGYCCCLSHINVSSWPWSCPVYIRSESYEHDNNARKWMWIVYVFEMCGILYAFALLLPYLMCQDIRTSTLLLRCIIRGTHSRLLAMSRGTTAAAAVVVGVGVAWCGVPGFKLYIHVCIYDEHCRLEEHPAYPPTT